jgi:hypothetical protein
MDKGYNLLAANITIMHDMAKRMVEKYMRV